MINPCYESNHNQSALKTVLPINTHPNPNTHVMVTRSKASIVKKKVLVADLSQTESATIKQALASPLWKQAMQEDIDALYRNGTWFLVTPPPNTSSLGCKWV